jgi:hypothetical protein
VSNSYVKTEGMVVDLKDANDAKNELSSFYSRPLVIDTFGLKIWNERHESYIAHQWG